jgi:hypothetical protein
MFGDSVVQEAETSRRNREFQRMQAAAAVRTQRKGNNTNQYHEQNGYKCLSLDVSPAAYKSCFIGGPF